MGTFLFTLGLSIIFTYLILTKWKIFRDDRALTIVFGFLTTACICFVSLLICVGVLSSLEPKGIFTENRDTPIYGMRYEHEGSFVLGIGSNKEEKSYYYYYKKAEKGYKLKKIETSRATLLYSNKIGPCVRTKLYKRTDKFWIFMLGEGNTINVFDNVEIYVPHGTIIEKHDFKK
jgi:hypothetical protein